MINCHKMSIYLYHLISGSINFSTYSQMTEFLITISSGVMQDYTFYCGLCKVSIFDALIDVSQRK